MGRDYRSPRPRVLSMGDMRAAGFADLPQNPRMTAASPFILRPAELRDVGAIVQLIRDLAEFEKLTHLLQVTPEKLRPHLFGEKPVAECWVAELPAGALSPGESPVVAFALFFTN